MVFHATTPGVGPGHFSSSLFAARGSVFLIGGGRDNDTRTATAISGGAFRRAALHSVSSDAAVVKILIKE